MADDIVVRLRQSQSYDLGATSVVYGWLHDDPSDEAADEITRLRADALAAKAALFAECAETESLRSEVERLRTALGSAVGAMLNSAAALENGGGTGHEVVRLREAAARAANEEKQIE